MISGENYIINFDDGDAWLCSSLQVNIISRRVFFFCILLSCIIMSGIILLWGLINASNVTVTGNRDVHDNYSNCYIINIKF